jgi:hypothetical protein
MFIMHISALFAYSVLLASTALLIWSIRNEGAGSSLGKTIGSLVFVLSLLSMFCIGYYSIKYWTQGNFETPMSMSMPMRQEMMQKMMPMMMEHMGQMGQMGNKGNMENMGMQKGENHSHTPQ